MTDPTHSRQAAQAADRSAGDLVKDLSEQVSRLVRDELKLAQVEMTAKGKRAGAGAGLLGGGGLLAWYGAACLLAAGLVWGRLLARRRHHRAGPGRPGLAGRAERRLTGTWPGDEETGTWPGDEEK
jgi:Putative Actinobacterial Holin-X, holin superfamily III